MYAKSNDSNNQNSVAYVPCLSRPILCHCLHWTDILSKTFIFSDPNSRVPNSSETFGFPLHKFYDIKQCKLHAQIFPDILYPTRLLHVVPYLFNDRARHRHDALILLRDIMASSTSILEYLVNVNTMHERLEIIQYQRVKIYIFILSHLGRFNKRV